MVRKEYDEIRAFTGEKKQIFKFFEEYGNSDRYKKIGGLASYKILRPIWYKEKIREPVALMNTLLFSGVSLAGKKVAQGVHPKFAEMLQRVDESIAKVTERLKKKPAISNPAMKPIAYIGCFRPWPDPKKVDVT